MTIIVPHHKTKAQAMDIVDRGANDLFAGVAGSTVAIVAFKKSWDGSTMKFSFTGSLGFIAIPLEGTVEVDDKNVTVHCELPAMVKNFIGDDKIAGTIEPKLSKMLLK